MKVHFLLLAILTLFVLNGCKESKEGKKASNSKISAIASRVDVLGDSIESSWNYMTKNEDEMLFNMKRLLQEIEYIPGHAVKPLDTLKTAIDSTKAIRYNQENMAESPRIDAYDVAIANLVNNVTLYANTVKGIEKYQVAALLLEEISQQNQKIYLNRVHYNFHVEDYNKLILQHKKKLGEFNNKYVGMKTMPKF